MGLRATVMAVFFLEAGCIFLHGQPVLVRYAVESFQAFRKMGLPPECVTARAGCL